MPVTISAFSMGMLVIPISTARFFRFMLCRLIQAMVPSTVAINADKNAIINVFCRA